MQTVRPNQEMSAVDALWTLYRQQPVRVRDAFRNRIAEEERTELRCLTTEEAKELTLKRGRDIASRRAKLIPHTEVKQEMEEMLATYAD